MLTIKVLGSGCAKCEKAATLIETIAGQLGASVSVSKETNPEVIMRYGVMSTPAVVIDEQLVHSGSIPATDQVKSWLK